MNRPAIASPFDSRLLAPGPLMLAGLILVAALSRLLPHPPNFTPVEAMGLFGGAYFANRRWAIAIPLIAMLLSDIALSLTMGGSYQSYIASLSFWSVYLCIGLTALLGFALRGRASAFRVLGFAFGGAALFFLVTNFATWLGSSMYPQTGAGLLEAYIAAIPFLRSTLLGTLVYAAAMFGGFELLRMQLPALRAQTV